MLHSALAIEIVGKSYSERKKNVGRLIKLGTF